MINEYLEKKYIRRVPADEQNQNVSGCFRIFQWYAQKRKQPKSESCSTGQQTCEGKSLNTEALPGPKLQSDITDILIKFRKEPVALAGDISQMYHQLVLRPEDPPLHRFLWRNLDTSKEPEVYEFLSVYIWWMLLPLLRPVHLANSTQKIIETNTLSCDSRKKELLHG